MCHLSKDKTRPLALVLVAVVAAVVVLAVIAAVVAVVVAVVAVVAVAVAVALCLGVIGLGVGMASKWIGHSLLLIGTRMVFVSLIYKRNSLVFHKYSNLYGSKSAKTIKLTLIEGVCRTFSIYSPFDRSTVPVPLTFCNYLLPI